MGPSLLNGFCTPHAAPGTPKAPAFIARLSLRWAIASAYNRRLFNRLNADSIFIDGEAAEILVKMPIEFGALRFCGQAILAFH
jgi:hypothetical protein